MPLKLDIKRHEKKNFWLAAGETFGFNIGLWAFYRYVQKGPYAYNIAKFHQAKFPTWSFRGQNGDKRLQKSVL